MPFKQDRTNENENVFPKFEGTGKGLVCYSAVLDNG